MKKEKSINSGNLRRLYFGDYFAGVMKTDMTLHKVDRMRTRLMIELHEAALEADPTNVAVVDALGHLYTRSGKYHLGLDMDLRLTRLDPENSLAWYNLACSFSLLRRIDEGLDALERAFDLGYNDFEHMLIDDDLSNLRGDPKFKNFLGTKKK